MAQLQIEQIHKAYGAGIILDGAAATFTDEQKIGVIGRNGAGKSTLCRIITGEDRPDSGKITQSADLRISYLEQHDSFQDGETVLDFLMRTTGREHWECGEMAAKFQIKASLLETNIRKLSGGFQTRVKLAVMLLGQPNFLILDEPSNYLDLNTLILLENFLLKFKGGYLVVSHDREFLKRTCEYTLEVERGQLTLYPGDIEEYFEFKEEQMNQSVARNKNLEKKKDQLQTFIDRFRAKASTASRAKSKMKQLARMKTIEIAHPMSSVRIAIPPVDRRNGVAFSSDDLAIGYPEKKVSDKISIDIDRGQHVAVLGDNGQGKTTFLKTLAGEIPPLGGKFRWALGLKVAYYAQHVFGTLDPEIDIYTYLENQSAEGVKSQDILNLAGSFLFRGDDVRKKVKVLSGGERARLVLAGLLLTKSQALLLDEPTNHLDFETVEALARALKNFVGTIFFISHDRTFVNLLATNIIEVKNGSVKRYPGTYEDYVYHLERVARGEEEETEPSDGLTVHSKLKKHEKADVKKETYELKEPAKTKPRSSELKKKMEKAEMRLKHLTAERDKIFAEMEKNPFHYSRARNDRLKQVQVAIEQAEAEWLKLGEGLSQN